MRKPASMRGLENLGRIRLSRHVYMRDCLNSDISTFHGIPNIPDYPDIAVRNGQHLARTLIDPLFDTFGPVHLRSAYRSPTLNKFGNDHKLNCSRNEINYGRRIWDYPARNGFYGATATIVIPWFADQFDQGRDWRDLAWWLHDHLPYSTLWFFPKLAAFNLEWNEMPLRRIDSYVAPKGTLLRAGDTPSEPLNARQKRYADFPPFRHEPYPE